jgi:hypothetical protein
MMIRLTDGTLLSSASHDNAPSRRSNKNQSGRQGRKTYNGRLTLQRAGGYKNEVEAIGQSADTPLCRIRTTSPSDARLRPMDQRLLGLYVSRREYTWDLGGSASTGYIGGRGM